MKRKLLSLGLILSLLLSLPVVGFAEEEEAPQYEEITLKTVEDFRDLAERCRLDSASRNLRVSLSEDLDLSGEENPEIPTFGGIFEGNGHKITGITIDAKGSDRGLFRYLQKGAVVRNLELTGTVAPQGSAGNVGGLVGVNNGTIEAVRFNGLVAGTQKVGGIAGTNTVQGTIRDCTVEGVLRGEKLLGGIVGCNEGIVWNCVNRAEVNTGVPEDSFDLGDLTMSRLTGGETLFSGSDIGGIAGTSSGVIRQSRNEGNVGYPHTGYNVGGVAGSQSGFLADCVNTGEIYARKEGGGILGQMEPNNLLVYNEDTLQKLQKELSTASTILNRTAGDAANANSAVQSGLSKVKSDMRDFLEAVELLLGLAKGGVSVTPSEEGGLPELDFVHPDKIWVAVGYVGKSLNQVIQSLKSVSGTAASEGGVVLEDLRSLTAQLNRVVNVMSGREEDTVRMEDVSGQDVQEDTPGKIRSCTNYGTVHADINAGGIVGAISWENDLDPEDDLQVQGKFSLNLTYKARALVYRCVNRGQVEAKKQAAGGIAGSSALGAIVECEGYGLMHCPDASWVGGIVGKSQAEVRACWAKCTVIGGSLCGGVAGEASMLYNCRALVTVENPGEYTGAIAGRLAEDAEGARNYFVESDSLAGIDGISYEGMAEPLGYGDFLKLDGVPEDFGEMVVTFVAEGRTFTRRVQFNKSLKSVPAVPEKAGYYGEWEGLQTRKIRADQTVYARYTPLRGAISTQTDAAQPDVLAEGAFREGDRVTAQALKTLPGNAALGWSITLPEDGGSSHRIHLRKPDPQGAYRVLLDTGSGWQERSAQEDGSYLVFTEESLCFQAALVPAAEGGPNWLLYGAFGAGAAVLILVLLLGKRRKAKTKTPEQG